MSLLHDFVEKKHCIFVEEAEDWRDAIRIGCKPLLADGTIDERYQKKVIECVEEFGPYIVLLPGYTDSDNHYRMQQNSFHYL